MSKKQHESGLSGKDIETEKKAANEAMIKRCKVCHKEIFPQFKCGGKHGVGAGGGSGGGDEPSQKNKKLDPTLTAAQRTPADEEHPLASEIQAPAPTTGEVSLQSSQEEHLFNAELISELLANKLLLIDNDRELGILTIKLQCNVNQLSEEQQKELKKFINLILNELNIFKKDNNISADCTKIQKDNEGNILSVRISLPTLALYEGFIKRIADKALLPLQNAKQQPNEKVEYEKGVNLFSLIPFSTKPTPSAAKAVDEESKSKSIRPLNPLDGLKPKGWQ